MAHQAHQCMAATSTVMVALTGTNISHNALGGQTHLPSSRPASAAATEPRSRQMPALGLRGGAW